MQFTCMLTKGGLDFRVKSLSTRKCCISLYINMHSAEGFILQQLKIKRQKENRETHESAEGLIVFADSGHNDT